MAVDVPITAQLQSSTGSTLLTITRGPVLPAAAPSYEMVAAGLTESRWRRDTIESPYVDYDAEISRARAAGTYELVTRLVGATNYASVNTLRDAVLEVAELAAWRLRVTIGGAVETYACRAADWRCPVTTELGINLRAELTLTIPARPL